ncbi:phosphonate C-P lyase system protein PhnG [Rhizobium deserti]|uniref:Phosphonate C-P lyase system protein PhnG n=1 Tax=Rhizobium deserti TaxID=2547961 RepID=A0A4R5UHQ5_9HYPH|nr:phosphonate C-P lyase system protein PhnG [Rhizobium deserti]TDK35511.1 phosphonate C-P lyase system protein PhnG [Rhizobium deserti]
MDAAQQTASNPQAEQRRRAIGLLARATAQELRLAWDGLPEKPDVKPVRGPETGLTMVRGRIGGGGAPFNLGEATVTRCTILLASGTAGHAQAMGTAKEAVKLAAVFDALWQEAGTRQWVETTLLYPIEARIAAEDKVKAEETAATKVDFFTMVRGED